MSMKDLFASFYSPVVELRLEQIDEAKQHLAFTRASASASISSVAKRTHGDQGSLHGECAYWDDKIDDARLVLKICKRDFYQQVRRESAPFCGFVLMLGVFVFLQV